jgi:hypothetical protein
MSVVFKTEQIVWRMSGKKKPYRLLMLAHTALCFFSSASFSASSLPSKYVVLERFCPI